MKCKNKVAIVTGAAGNGMGRSIALTLAREGAKVVINYHLNKQAVDAIIKHIENFGGTATSVQADIFQADECKKLVDETEKRFGKVDICIIGPGGGWHPESIEQLNAEAALSDLNQEVSPVYFLMPLVLPGMYERKWGRIIALGMSSPYASPAYAYNVGKAARAFAMLLARNTAWENGVTVNVIAPGPVSEIKTLEEAIEQCNHGQTWLQRKNVSPQDIAEAVAFLCSDEASFISGSELPFMFH